MVTDICIMFHPTRASEHVPSALFACVSHPPQHSHVPSAVLIAMHLCMSSMTTVIEESLGVHALKNETPNLRQNCRQCFPSERYDWRRIGSLLLSLPLLVRFLWVMPDIHQESIPRFSSLVEKTISTQRALTGHRHDTNMQTSRITVFLRFVKSVWAVMVLYYSSISSATGLSKTVCVCTSPPSGPTLASVCIIAKASQIC